MNFKPFYVSTDEISEGCISVLWGLAITHGAKPYNVLAKCAITRYYVGVDFRGNTNYFDMPSHFGSEAVELTYEEALLHVQGKDDKYRILEGESEDSFPVSDIDTKELDKILMMDTISLRLPEPMIKDLIEATEGKINYKTLIRKLIKEYLNKGDK